MMKMIDQAANSIATRFNPEPALESVGNWLDKHHQVNKVVLVANHFFRAAAMYTFMSALPFSTTANVALSVASSLFYRVTIERFCPFKFAIPATLGAGAFMLSKPALLALVQKSALGSISLLAKSLVGASPAILYAIGIAVHCDSVIEEKRTKGGCCSV